MEEIKQQMLDILSEFVAILNLTYNYNLNSFIVEERSTYVKAVIAKHDTKSRFVHICYFPVAKEFYVEVYHWDVKTSRSYTGYFKNIIECREFIQKYFDSVDATYKTVFKKYNN